MDGETTFVRLHDLSSRIDFFGKVRACIWALAVFTRCKAQTKPKELEWENVYDASAALLAYNPETLCLGLYICVCL